MAISVSSRKAKGRNLQTWVRDQILENSPTLEIDDVKSTSMGASGEDVQFSPAARKLWPFSIECKSHKSFAVYGIYSQAVGNCPKGAEPLVVIKQNRSKPLVIVDAEWFFDKMGYLL